MQGSGIVVVLLIFLTITWSIDYYLYQGVLTAIKDWEKQIGAQLVKWGFWILSIGLPLTTLIGFVVLREPPKASSFSGILVNLSITFMVTKLVFLLFILGEDIYRLFYWVYDKVTSSGDVAMPSRRKFVSQVGILTAAVPFTAFIYGITKGRYRYTVRKKTLYFSDLPEAFDGFTITQISDVHSGSFDDKQAVQRGIDLINEQKSDLFVFTGDLVNSSADEFDDYRDLFAQVRAPYGQYSILGNHDYADYGSLPTEEAKEADRAKLRQHHKDIGYKLLRDENVRIEKDGSHISLLGVENWGKGFGERGDLEKALLGVDTDSFKVLLSHDPTHFEEQVKKHPKQIHLTLSGHTHGMQMGVEFGNFKWSPVKFRYPHWADLKEENGRKLYVNRGFGFIGFTGRVGIWPEITVLELKRGEA